jgi:hypothetical protein
MRLEGGKLYSGGTPGLGVEQTKKPRSQPLLSLEPGNSCNGRNGSITDW